MKKYVFDNFRALFIVLDHMAFAGQNTQHWVRVDCDYVFRIIRADNVTLISQTISGRNNLERIALSIFLMHRWITKNVYLCHRKADKPEFGHTRTGHFACLSLLSVLVADKAKFVFSWLVAGLKRILDVVHFVS